MDINNGDKYKSAKWKYVNAGNIFSQREKAENMKITQNSNREVEMGKNNRRVTATLQWLLVGEILVPSIL